MALDEVAAQLFDVLDTVNTRFTFRNLMYQFGLLHFIRPAWSSIIKPKGLSISPPVFYNVFGRVSVELTLVERWEIYDLKRMRLNTHNYQLVAVLPIFGKQSTVLCGAPIVLLVCGCHEHHVGGVWHGGDLWRKGWRMASHTLSPAGRCCHLKHSPTAFAMLLLQTGHRFVCCSRGN